MRGMTLGELGGIVSLLAITHALSFEVVPLVLRYGWLSLLVAAFVVIEVVAWVRPRGRK